MTSAIRSHALLNGSTLSLRSTPFSAKGSTRTASTPTFCVLLGPDYAGKSSVMSELRIGGPPWRFVSTDDAFLSPQHDLIGRLRRELLAAAIAPGAGYSSDFVAAMMQLAVLHLRDRLLDTPDGSSLVVDSYYYKILAKCRLAGVTATPIFDWWRSFPQPRRVLYLDVSRESAWLRCQEGARLNRLEHYGPEPSRTAFERYQADLAETMLEEIRNLPVTVIGGNGGRVDTANAVREALHAELD